MKKPPINLKVAARQAMLDNGFLADFPTEVEQIVAQLTGPIPLTQRDTQDLRNLPWSSIDNPESRDLDQLEVSEMLSAEKTRLRIAIADVDSHVIKDSTVDKPAAHNTTSVYTGVTTFPMLPERLSTDLTSLNEDADRLAIVVDMTIETDGAVSQSEIYPALVHNHAKLDYISVGDWLEGRTAVPEKIRYAPELEQQVRMQHSIAQRLRQLRADRGALNFETLESRPVMEDNRVVDMHVTKKNAARELIEDFMIAANVSMAAYLENHGWPTLQRVVHTPKRWARIVELAAQLGEPLPTEPDGSALSNFLIRRREMDPMHFPDLSLSIVKLLGAGEYVLEKRGEDQGGHFGLAVEGYTHSTAPNRRYADLITQRLVKAAFAGAAIPYNDAELAHFAGYCNDRERAARKVQRLVRKQAAALMLYNRIGERFWAIVTGVKDDGVFARVSKPQVEGRIVRGEAHLDVGDRVRVRLLSTDPKRGFIDFSVDQS